MKFWSKKNNVQKHKFINVEIVDGVALSTNFVCTKKVGFKNMITCRVHL